MEEQVNVVTVAEENGGADFRREKKRKPAVLLLAVLLLVSLAGNALQYLRYDRLSDYVADMDTIYSESYFHFDSLTIDSFREKVASGEEFAVIITRPGCPNCQAMEAPVIGLTEDMGIADRIYHLNVELFRRDGEAWARFKEDYGLQGTPTYARYAGGGQVSNVGWTPESGIEFASVKQWIEEQADLWER